MATAVGPWNDKYEVSDEIVPTEVITEPTPETPEEVTSEVTPTVVTETETTTAVETPPTQVEVIKEVEKIVEKYPEMDEYTGEIFKALMDGDESRILSYLTEKHKDYKTMSDYDVIKSNLKASNPNYTDEIAELKMERTYGDLQRIDVSKLDEDSDEYATAQEHNAKVAENHKLLKLDAFDARIALDAAKKEIKLPKITTDTPPVNNQPTAEQLEQGRKDWEATVDDAFQQPLDFTFKVGDDKAGYEDVAFKITDAEKAKEQEFFKSMDLQKLFVRLGWQDATGKQNLNKLAGDVLKLEKAGQIAASAYTQGKTAGAKQIGAQIKNIDLSATTASSVAATPPDIGLALFGHLNPK